MPFDQSPTTTDVKHPSLEGLIQWLEGQDQETEYDYLCCEGGCLIDTYLAANGLEVGKSGAGLDNYVFTENLVGSVAVAQPWTYSAALDRARALLNEGM